MAHGLGLASDSCVCVLPCRSPGPGVNRFDDAFLQSPSMAYGSALLGVNGFHYIHEHHRRKVSTSVRRIHSHTPHSGLLCHSASFGDLGVASGCFRGLQNLPKHWKLAHTRPLIYDRTDWVCICFYRCVICSLFLQITYVFLTKQTGADGSIHVSLSCRQGSQSY